MIKKEVRMDVYLHTVITFCFMVATYIWGRYGTKKEILEDVISSMLDSLEKDGFIKTEIDENGEKELIPISEIKAKL